MTFAGTKLRTRFVRIFCRCFASPLFHTNFSSLRLLGFRNYIFANQIHFADLRLRTTGVRIFYLRTFVFRTRYFAKDKYVHSHNCENQIIAPARMRRVMFRSFFFVMSKQSQRETCDSKRFANQTMRNLFLHSLCVAKCLLSQKKRSETLWIRMYVFANVMHSQKHHCETRRFAL